MSVQGRKKFYIITRGLCFWVFADCGESAAIVFKTAIRASRMLASETDRPVQQALRAVLGAIFGESYSNPLLPRYLIKDDYNGTLTFSVMDGERKRVLCSQHHSRCQVFIWREPFDLLRDKFPGAVHDFIARELGNHERLQQALDQILNQGQP